MRTEDGEGQNITLMLRGNIAVYVLSIDTEFEISDVISL